MPDISLLGQVALGYSPFIDVSRTVIATRLTVFPIKPDLVLDVSQLLGTLGEVWPAEGGRVSLNVASETLLHDLLQAKPTANFMIEVPAFMAGEPSNIEPIKALHSNGSTLLLKGRPLRELPRELLQCFKYSIIDFSDDRRLHEVQAPAGAQRLLQHVQGGVRTIANMEFSFTRKAVAVIGWPLDDVIPTGVPHTGINSAQADIQVIVELIQLLDQQAPIDKLEKTLKRDPTLAYKLMRYMNSPAFALRVEITSFSHAIMMLGYQKLKSWLALLLVTASQEPNLKPVMFSAVRRGLLLEELGRGSLDDESRSEIFICGVFSLLDRMFKQSFESLLQNIPVPERVYQALAQESGPFQVYLEMVKAIESESRYDFKRAAKSLMMGVDEINLAILRALTAAMQLD